eukprot:TRINITY_DN25187_c0_g1_i4.p1 TRINITY_DN25187_c0_g1~~TRINITY_DN25187_c0_g1_i4.p1  ORF type:complete len:147 (-),score=15.92 TRINITY_DN25187_c0_g1_i4:113-553(-)
MALDFAAVVIDNGSSMCKAGFAGDDAFQRVCGARVPGAFVVSFEATIALTSCSAPQDGSPGSCSAVLDWSCPQKRKGKNMASHRDISCAQVQDKCFAYQAGSAVPQRAPLFTFLALAAISLYNTTRAQAHTPCGAFYKVRLGAFQP